MDVQELIMHSVLAATWVWSGWVWSEGSPQPKFVRAIWYLFAASELAAAANLTRLDEYLTVAVVAATVVMFALRYSAKHPPG